MKRFWRNVLAIGPDDRAELNANVIRRTAITRIGPCLDAKSDRIQMDYIYIFECKLI